MSVSVSMIVRNSSDVLERCLESVKDADEIVIVDTGSTDNTKEIARKYTDKIYDYYGCNEGSKPDGLFANFADARNKALSYCTKTYVLTIDSDEYLVNGAMDIFKQFKGNALSIRCINEATKEEHRQPRLHINKPEVFWKGAAHNYLNCGSGEKSNIVIMYGKNKQKKTDPNRTMRILKRWVKNNPLNNTRELYYLGREYHKRGLFKEAIKIFNKYINRSNFLAEKADAFVQLSRCYAALGYHEKAINNCLAAINLNPMFGEALRLAGDLSGNVNRLKYRYLANRVDNNGVLFIRKDQRIKVTILSIRDFAGSGYRIAQAVRMASKGLVDVECITEVEGSAFGIVTGPGIEETGYDVVKERIQSSDIIHFKGDWPYENTWPNINVNPVPNILKNTFIRHSRIEPIRLPGRAKYIYTVSGSLFRKKTAELINEVALELFPIENFKADFLSSMEPDLCYTKDCHHMPYPYLDFKYVWKKAKKFRIVHIPSARHKKGSDTIDRAIEILRLQRNDFEYVCKSGISFEDCIKLKSSAHLYIDQMIVNAYGNSAVEAMAFGIPVLCGIDKNLYNDCPVIIPEEITAESIANKINESLDWNLLQDISLKTFNYCQSTHGSVGQWWFDVYKELAKNINYDDEDSITGDDGLRVSTANQ